MEEIKAPPSGSYISILTSTQRFVGILGQTNQLTSTVGPSLKGGADFALMSFDGETCSVGLPSK